jgi:putative hydrolase of the HAD superfamily
MRAIVLDFYGTLVDVRTDEWRDDVFQFLSEYLKYYGARIDPKEMRRAIGRAKDEQFKTGREKYPELDLELSFAALLRSEGLADPFMVQSCCRLFRLLSRDWLRTFPETLAVLAEMKKDGHAVAVVSNAQRVFFKEESDMLGLTGYFDHIVLSSAYGFQKPDPRLFSIACSLLNVPPDRSVYIGDDPSKDIPGPKRIGMKTVLVRRQEEMFDGPVDDPDFVARDLAEAWEWIRRLK